METKIIVALVVGMVLVSLTGAASAYDPYEGMGGGSIYSSTNMYGSHLSSTSQTSVSGMPLSSSYSQTLVAEFVYPTFPQYDLSVTKYDISGTDYSTAANVQSSPIGSETAITIDSPADVSGSVDYWNCALWGAGEGARTAYLPQAVTEPDTWGWKSSHTYGSTYPTHITEEYYMMWP